MPLTEKRERFCIEYVKDFNGTQAAVRAGYSEATADRQASRLLRYAEVWDRINELQDELKRDSIASAVEIREGHTRDVRFSLADFLDEHGDFRPSAFADASKLAAVTRYKQTERFLPDGTRIVTREIWGPDKIRARAELSKLNGLYEQPEGANVTVNLFNVPPLIPEKA